MSKKLYERCGHCEGTRKLAAEITVVRGGVDQTLPAGSECPFCSTGYHEIGLTDGQLRAVIDERDALLEFVDRVASTLPVHFHEHELLKREAGRLTEGKSARAAEYRFRAGLGHERGQRP